ncbi:hypothetical protein LTR62_005478 [Meristemomyces frigidus]|uniref:FAD dependent oxidoreductase domain-containing protein n=1 Tax=Meristemomyces frigidus TaxID=1508187 RepID=A0AAN7TKX9_9PEZI|nr:hypothetical protein LTR62_005478 [Meristemomyces frigidus]
MPGDADIEYASPWAGANYAPVSKKGTVEAEYDLNTWPELYRLAKSVPEAGAHFQQNVVYNRDEDAQTATAAWFSDLLSSKPWFADSVPDFRKLKPSELPPGVNGGISYTSVCINTPQYLHYLLGQCLRNGVVVKRAVITHISRAAQFHATSQPADIVVNCTGLGSLVLGGVLDNNLYPARGHVVLVRNETPDRITFVSGTDDGPEETTYIMMRGAGGGTIIGGCYQRGQTDPTPDPAMGRRILQRAARLCPEMVGGKGVEGFDVVRHGVGLRPVRTGGPRLERERVEGVAVVHNYGHGGAGYQCSYGCAQAAVRLVRESLASRVRL